MGIPLATQYKAGLLSPRDKALLDKLGMTPAALDYTPQPLPLIGVWSNYGNSTFGLSVYDSDADFVGATTQATFNPFGNELAGTYVGYTTTTSRVSSNAQTTAWIKATTAVSADGHQVMGASSDGTYSVRLVSVDFGTFGVIVGGPGYRQNFSLVQNGLTLRQHLRGKNIVIDTLGTTGSVGNLGTYSNSASTAATSAKGLVGYNRNTNTLVMLEPTNTNGTTFRAHIYVNPNRKIGGRTGELFDFLDEAVRTVKGATYRYIDFTWPVGSATTLLEGAYRARVVPCNNGKISITRMIPNSRIETGVLVPAATGNSGTFTLKSPTGFQGLTTSYGYDQGAPYGMRHQISWDNKWIIAYAPYYYYGCGIVSTIISVDDPDNYFTYNYNSTADGSQPLPFGVGGFLIGQSDFNADSNVGLTATLISMDNNRQPNGTVPTAGSALTGANYNSLFDTAYTSTNYPCLVPIERWTLPGFASNPG